MQEVGRTVRTVHSWQDRHGQEPPGLCYSLGPGPTTLTSEVDADWLAWHRVQNKKAARSRQRMAWDVATNSSHNIWSIHWLLPKLQLNKFQSQPVHKQDGL